MSKAVPPSERTSRLAQLRQLKMARTPHAYVRGSTQTFYRWLASPAGTELPQGPPVWICGDCHVGNLGPIGRSSGSPVVEIRDLDQTVIGNPAHDLARLGLSLAMSARGSLLPGVATARMTEDLVAGYTSAFAGEVPSEDANELPPPIGAMMREAIRRTHKTLLKERLGEEVRRFRLGRRFWPLRDDERSALQRLVATPSVQKLVTQLASRDDGSEVSLLDAAYWVKGCSSLGLFRAALLVEVRGLKKRRVLSLVDVKEAVAPLAPASGELPDDPAERVVTGAKLIAPALGKRMASATVLDHSVFVRELLPQDLKVELDQISIEDGRAVAYYLGSVVGRAHSRQMHGPDRRSWETEMNKRSKSLDVPSWLWSAVIDLIGVHERAYLEHCRRYALEAEGAK